MSQENVEIVRQAFGAWNRGDIEGYIAHLCSDVQAVPMGAALEGKVWRGHDEIRAWARTHPEVWETLLIWAEEFQQVDEELLLVSGHWDAVGRSGVEMSAPATWVFGFRDMTIATMSDVAPSSYVVLAKTHLDANSTSPDLTCTLTAGSDTDVSRLFWAATPVPEPSCCTRATWFTRSPPQGQSASRAGAWTGRPAAAAGPPHADHRHQGRRSEFHRCDRLTVLASMRHVN